MKQKPLDPVKLAMVQNRLDHISHQMGWVMMRTARSPIFSQSHDFSCFLADPDGTLVSQADGIPIHTGGGGFAVRAILKAYSGEIGSCAIGDGDVFLLNDPYTAGGNHLPDWVIARPVFIDGELRAFACNRAHQADIGGGAAGTYNSAATEIFHEGIRLPALKLIEAGELRQDLWKPADDQHPHGGGPGRRFAGDDRFDPDRRRAYRRADPGTRYRALPGLFRRRAEPCRPALSGNALPASRTVSMRPRKPSTTIVSNPPMPRSA